ncbi:MAG: hypothetical protein GY816_15285 [Cytophagales bacterium]|nr:hypothetical protein [Cytophagales bacterium]
MESEEKPEVYFHVGLGKVASSYLQQRVFPRLDGIKYISTHKYKKSISVIKKAKHKKYLVSREFDRQFEREVKWFSSHFPDTQVIIVLRRHDSWLASQYRRFVKNGRTLNFSEFFNLDESKSFWKHEHILFYWKLELIEKCFTKKPLVLFHDELKEDAWVFFNKISQYAGVSYDKVKVSLKPTHPSYSEKQLRVLRGFCRRYKKEPPKGYSNKLKHWLFYRPWWALFHLIMYAAAYFPVSWVPKEPIIQDDELKPIRVAFDDDWKRVQAYAKKNNPHWSKMS